MLAELKMPRERNVSHELKQSITSHGREMLEFARELISIPTENPPGMAATQCAAVLRDRLRRMKFPIEPKTLGGIVRSFYGRGQRTLYFHGHYDVVPAASRAQFQPAVRAGKLFGRGSSDMKGGLVAMIYAVRALEECAVKPDGRIALTFVPDEETGGARGTQVLADHGLIEKNAVGMLTPEPTGGVVWNASRGAISMRVTLKGKTAHVGLAHAGRNAFESMLTACQEMMTLKAKVSDRKTRYSIRPAPARRSILLLGGECRGGTNFNTVPAECSFTIDRRTNPEEDLAVEKHRLIEIFSQLKRRGMDLEVELLQESEPSATPRDSELSRALASAVQQVTRKAPRFEMCPGLLETRFYNRMGVPALAYGPGLLSVSHGPAEYVPVRNIFDCALVYALTAVNILSAHSGPKRHA
jgi:succinyl-diaminopimelate desuccinylase